MPAAPAVQLTMARLEAEVPLRPDTLWTLMTSLDGKVRAVGVGVYCHKVDAGSGSSCAAVPSLPCGPS